jgi:hypothetical protein
MVNAVKRLDGSWIAYYAAWHGGWQLATDARGVPIACETETLALSVARYRRRRLRRFQ